MKLILTDPPKVFDPNMTDEDLQLFLNVNKISYKVCKILQGKRCITI